MRSIVWIALAILLGCTAAMIFIDLRKDVAGFVATLWCISGLTTLISYRKRQ